MDITTHKRHSCEAYKKFKKANPQPKGSLSETFSTHSSDRGGILVEVPYRGSGRWVRKKWRDEFNRYLTDEQYKMYSNFQLYIKLNPPLPMSDFYEPYDKSNYDYTDLT